MLNMTKKKKYFSLGRSCGIIKKREKVVFIWDMESER